MSLGVLIGLVLGLFLLACTPSQLDQTAGTIANVELVKQCNELRLQKDEVLLLTEALDIRSGQSIPAGVAAETDQALPITPSKSAAVDIAEETDIALPVGQLIVVPVGPALETDTAIGIATDIPDPGVIVTGQDADSVGVDGKTSASVSLAGEAGCSISFTGSKDFLITRNFFTRLC